MASALSVEGFFSALTGGNNEPEIDFPFDRLFRKIGVYLRCLMGAILIGAAIQNPATCFSPGNENGKNEFVNSYCISLLKHPVKFNETTKEPIEEKIYLFHWLPYVLFVEAFLAFLPFLIYSGNTKAIISPILNEAQDMVIFTSGLFEGTHQKEPPTENGTIDPDDDEDNDQTYAQSIQINLKKRLYAKMALFIGQRLEGVRGDELVDAYHFAHIVVKLIVVVLQGILLVGYFYFSSPFPRDLSCHLPASMHESLEFKSANCVFPNNGLFLGMAILDAVLLVLLPLLSYRQYRNYWSLEFNHNLQRARRLVSRNRAPQFKKFIELLCESPVDDVRLTLALLHSNVDKYIINKILTVYAGRIDWEAVEVQNHQFGKLDFSAKYPCSTVPMYRCILPRLKPYIPAFPYFKKQKNLI